jgi:hypothetical protein
MENAWLRSNSSWSQRNDNDNLYTRGLVSVGAGASECWGGSTCIHKGERDSPHQHGNMARSFCTWVLSLTREVVGGLRVVDDALGTGLFAVRVGKKGNERGALGS